MIQLNESNYRFHFTEKVRLGSPLHRGALITVCGTDGSGKTTLLECIQQYLANAGCASHVIDGLSDECKSLSYFKSYVAAPDRVRGDTIDLTALVMICLGDRLMNLRIRAIPLLQRCNIVLQDRYVYTSLAEILVAGCSLNEYRAIVRVTELFFQPHLGILLIAPVPVIYDRIRSRPEEAGLPFNREYYRRLIEAYRIIATDTGLEIVDSSGPIKSTFEQIRPRLDTVVDALNRQTPENSQLEI